MANSYDVARPFTRSTQEIVNWGSCTAEEILDYEEQGQEVPEQYLSWAEEMAASMNAQDNLTYEMAQAMEGGTGNSAEDFRNELSENGVSLKQQGKIFIEESKTKEENTLQYITQMAPLLNVAKEIETEAGKIADETTTQLEALKTQIQTMVDEKNDKPKLFQSRAQRGEIAGLEAVAKALGAQAEGELQGLDAELEEVDSIVNSGFASSSLSVDYGTETVKIGAELVGKGSKASKIGAAVGAVAGGIGGIGMIIGGLLGGIFGGLFGGGKKKVGKEAIEQGSQTVTVGQQGQEIAQQSADAHGVTIKSVEKSANDVKSETQGNTTGVEDNQTPTTADSNQTETTAGNTTEEIISQDPSVVITDPNEIIKRKERRGLV